MILYCFPRRAAGVILILGCLISATANAKSCFPASQAVDPAKIAAHKAAIDTDAAKWLLSRGGGLTSAVRDLAGSEPDYAPTLVQKSKGASPQQAAAIGAGLGQAAAACIGQPEDAAKIQAAVALSSDQSLVASYASTGANTQTAATGGGGAAGGGGGGGGAGAGGGGGIGALAASTSRPAPALATIAATSTGSTNTFSNLLTGGSATSGSITTTTTVSTVSSTVGSSVSTHSAP